MKKMTGNGTLKVAAQCRVTGMKNNRSVQGEVKSFLFFQSSYFLLLCAMHKLRGVESENLICIVNCPVSRVKVSPFFPQRCVFFGTLGVNSRNCFGR